MKYKIIYADPPWKYGASTSTGRGHPEKHYQTMDTYDICRLPVEQLADQDCCLFLWETWPKLEDAMMVIRHWGFEYKTIAFLWVKRSPAGGSWFYGLGGWTRANSEFCLLATKGRPKRINGDVFQLVTARIREHSRKPDEVRGRIVRLLGDLPRIELFARQKFEGWDVWGNEAPAIVQKVLE